MLYTVVLFSPANATPRRSQSGQPRQAGRLVSGGQPCVAAPRRAGSPASQRPVRRPTRRHASSAARRGACDGKPRGGLSRAKCGQAVSDRAACDGGARTSWPAARRRSASRRLRGGAASGWQPFGRRRRRVCPSADCRRGSRCGVCALSVQVGLAPSARRPLPQTLGKAFLAQDATVCVDSAKKRVVGNLICALKQIP